MGEPLPLRVGMFTASLPEAGRKPGGVDVMIDRLANELAKAGHEVTVWSYSPAPDGASYRHESLTPRSLTFNKLARMTVVPLALNRLRFDDMDVLHLHGDDWFFTHRRLPTVRTLYGSALYEARSAHSMKRRLSQYLQVPLEGVSSRLATRSYSLIPGEIPLQRTDGFLPCAPQGEPARDESRSAAPSILFVGTWGGRKRGSLLFETFVNEVRPAFPGAELWMVADYAPEAEGVRLFTAPAAEEVMRLFASSWVFCLPSLYEGFGVPYVEALASGTPVVASANPGSRFILEDGRYGRIVADHELGSCINGLLGRASQRADLAAAGRARASDFTWQRVVALHEQAYLEAMRVWRGSGRGRRRQRG